MNLREKASTTYHIKDVMGCDLTTLTINIEELKSDWHLFELRIVVEEPHDQNRLSKINQQPTKSNHPDLAMALKMRGSINNAVKAKARAATEAKKKVTAEEKKMSTLQQLLNKIRKQSLMSIIGPNIGSN